MIKRGLADFRGGSQRDYSFILLDNDTQTELFYSVLKSCLSDVTLIYRGACNKLISDSLFMPYIWDSKKRAYNSTRTNRFYIGYDRKVIMLDSKSSASAIFLVLAFLEVYLDSVSYVATYPASNVFEAYYVASGWEMNVFVQHAKYCTAYPIARYLDNPLPKKPSTFIGNATIFGHKFKKMIRCRYKSVNISCTSLFQGLLQGVKRGASVVPECYVESSYYSHIKILTQKVPELDEAFADSFLRKSNFIMKDFSMSVKQMLQLTEPSKAASFGYGFAAGGQESDLLDSLNSQLNGSAFSSDSLIVQFDEYARTRPLVLEEYKSLLKIYNPLETKSKTFETLKGKELPFDFKLRALKETYNDYFDRPIACRVVAIREFLKVRIITAGEGLPYYLGKSYQRSLFKYLYQFEQFELMGEPLNISHLERMVIQEKELELYIDKNLFPYRFGSSSYTLGFDQFVSGDYSAATDNISIKYTLMSFDSTIRSILGRNHSITAMMYTHVCRKLLEPHFLYYNLFDLGYRYNTVATIFPKLVTDFGNDLYAYFDGQIFFFPEKNHVLGYTYSKFPNMSLPNRMKLPPYVIIKQKNGQLMGSPISFPHLCNINVIAYWISLEKYCNYKIPFNLLPVRVNGDDITFRTNSKHYRYWLTAIEEVGFKLSLGKNYVHPSVLTLNSIMYTAQRSFSSPCGFRFKEVPYLNVGLLMGQSKGKGTDFERKLSLEEMYNLVLLGAKDKIRAHRRFISYNLKQIQLMTGNGKFNLFIPRQYGGIGFPFFSEVSSEIIITPFQRRFARFFFNEIELLLSEGVVPDKLLFSFQKKVEGSRGSSVMLKEKVGSIIVAPIGPYSSEYVPYLKPSPIIAGPLQKPVLLETLLKEELEYRYKQPSKAVLRRFDLYQQEVVGTLSESMSNEQLLLSGPLILLKRIK